MNLDGIILFHKKHHNILLIIEVSLLAIVAFFMSILSKTEVFVMTLDDYELYSSAYELKFVDDVFNYIPFAIIIFELVFILIISFVKNKKGNAILSKKMCHVLFYISIAAIVFDLLNAIFGQTIVIQDVVLITTHSNLLGRFVTTMCQVFVMIDIYLWRENFGLEKLYG